jgi:hypothetical protein
MNSIHRKANSVEMRNTTHHRGAKGGLRRLRRPQALVYAALAIGIAAAVPVSAGAASSHQTLAKPSGLQTFKRHKNDTRRTAFALMPTFTRTPAFAWSRVRGAARYEFQLSTSRDFQAENGLVWSGQTGFVPTAAVPIALPWSTGEPHSASFYWRVRALNGSSAPSSWSDPAPFRMGWGQDTGGIPAQVTKTPDGKKIPDGIISWGQVDGATGYQVWFTNFGFGHKITTVTNVADLREYATSQPLGSEVTWRVRAERRVYGQALNALPAVSYGPWSETYKSHLPDVSTGAPHLQAISDAVSTEHDAHSHSLVPAFMFPTKDGGLHRVYIATDENCVNIVHVSPAVAGDAYAPRSIGGGGSPAVMADGTGAAVSESVLAKLVGGAAASGASPFSHALEARGAIDLWDSDWSTGRYYWTVVPVDGQGHDVVTPQDECQDYGVRAEFKKTSEQPRLGGPEGRYLTGLSPRGHLFSATSSNDAFYGSPLAAWKPSSAAVAYDVEWTRTPRQWSSAHRLRTFATSAILPLSPGTWWYRVRGINDSLPGNEEMRWTAPSRVRIVRPTFSVHGG